MKNILATIFLFMAVHSAVGEDFEHKIGVVLSGGAARGFAHLGALQALEENGIVPSYVAGASMGAIIGSIYASGKSPAYIYDFARKQKYSQIVALSRFRSKGGILKATFIHEMLNELVGHSSFELLQKRMFVAVTNLDMARSEIIDSGCLKTAVSASAAVPLIFEPVSINGYSYVDGGVLNNLPVEPLLRIEDCRYIIGISVIAAPIKNNKRWKGTEPVIRAINLMVKNTEMENRRRCHFFVEIEEASMIGLTDFKHIDTLYKMGYEAMSNYIAATPALRALSTNYENSMAHYSTK